MAGLKFSMDTMEKIPQAHVQMVIDQEGNLEHISGMTTDLKELLVPLYIFSSPGEMMAILANPPKRYFNAPPAGKYGSILMVEASYIMQIFPKWADQFQEAREEAIKTYMEFIPAEGRA